MANPSQWPVADRQQVRSCSDLPSSPRLPAINVLDDAKQVIRGSQVGVITAGENVRNWGAALIGNIAHCWVVWAPVCGDVCIRDTHSRQRRAENHIELKMHQRTQ